jgi:RNA polymerase sigma factor (sigma-70 family)
MNETSDIVLLERWRAGDRQAGNLLYGRYYPQVTRYFANSVGQRERSDLTQHTFERLTKAKTTFAGDCSFRTFVFSVAHHVLLDHLRARYRGRGDFDPITHTVEDIENPSPSAALSELGRHERVLRALRVLPLETKQLLELRYWHGMTSVELAPILGITDSGVRSRIEAARQTLRERYCELEGSPAIDDQDLERRLQAVRELMTRGPAQE